MLPALSASLLPVLVSCLRKILSSPFTFAVIPGCLSRTVKGRRGTDRGQELFDLDTTIFHVQVKVFYVFSLSLSLCLVFSRRRIWTWIGALYHVL